MKTVALFSIKGGVGKTAAAVNLAHLAARGGARTLLWDLDPQGAASFYLRIRPKLAGGSRRLLKRKNRLAEAVKASDFAGLDVVPADFSLRSLVLALNDLGNPLARLRRLLRPMRRDYDLVFVDCAPGVSLVSDAVMRASDLVLVPTVPTTLSLRTYAQLLAHSRANSLDAAIVPLLLHGGPAPAAASRHHGRVREPHARVRPNLHPLRHAGRADGPPADAGDRVCAGQRTGPRLRAALGADGAAARSPRMTTAERAGITVRGPAIGDPAQ